MHWRKCLICVTVALGGVLTLLARNPRGEAGSVRDCGEQDTRREQERKYVLDASEVSANTRVVMRGAALKLGLPEREDETRERYKLIRHGRWTGSDDLDETPDWTMWEMMPDSLCTPDIIAPVLAFFRGWASAKPKNTVAVVYGPLKRGWYVVGCSKTKGGLGWKSLGFAIPQTGVEADRKLLSYSIPVNWVEAVLGYNFFPLLPSHLQEIIEEMTVTELFCSFQEFEQMEFDGPDDDIEYDTDGPDRMDLS